MTYRQRWALWLALGLGSALLGAMVEPSRGQAQEAVELSPEAVTFELEPVEELGIVDETPAPPQLPLDVPTLIVQAAQRYGLNVAQFQRVAWCESRLNPLAYNSRDGSIGVFQFQPRTFAWASVQAGYAGYSPFNAEANVYSAAWLYAQPGGFRHWTCR